eukprot:5167765-Prorocentrum_lima.AAC.1
MTLGHWYCVILKACNRLLSTLDYATGMEPGSLLNHHADTCSLITATLCCPQHIASFRLLWRALQHGQTI